MEPFKMKYDVYLIGRGSGVYAQDYFREYIGSTWAISKEQACSNVRYRLKDDTKPHGGYSSEIVGDRLDEGAVFYSYEAKLSESRGLITTKVEVDCAPAIDADPVVRCKDCRFWENEHLCLVMSRYGSIDTKAEHYCSWGEKREA